MKTYNKKKKRLIQVKRMRNQSLNAAKMNIKIVF